MSLVVSKLAEALKKLVDLFFQGSLQGSTSPFSG
jgi:hypothetical protein